MRRASVDGTTGVNCSGGSSGYDTSPVRRVSRVWLGRDDDGDLIVHQSLVVIVGAARAKKVRWNDVLLPAQRASQYRRSPPLTEQVSSGLHLCHPHQLLHAPSLSAHACAQIASIGARCCAACSLSSSTVVALSTTIGVDMLLLDAHPATAG